MIVTRLAALSLALLLVAAPGSAQDDTPDVGFQVGEELVYKIYWGFIPVGHATATSRWVDEDGRKLLVLTLRGHTNHVLQKLYPVDDMFESVIDPVTFLPLSFIKKQSEGRYRSHEMTTFDYTRLKARWVSFLNNGTLEYDMQPESRDLITLMYFIRHKAWADGETYKAHVMTEKKLYELEVDVLERETVKIVNGEKVPSVKLEPRAKFNGLFVRKGRAFMWVSEEKPSVVTKLTTKIPVASVSFLLDTPDADDADKDDN